MSQIQEIFNRIQKTKKEQREIKAVFRDALLNSGEYRQVAEDLKMLKEKKKKIEERVRDEFASEWRKLDSLKTDIESDNILLSDAAVNKIVSGERIEVKDENDYEYEPIVSVRFKKIS